MARRFTLAEVATRPGLRELAGERYFERGEAYFRDGVVEELRSDESEISARVIGSQVYRARLRVAKGTLDWRCSCPLGDGGEFCKHLVALGLAWLACEGKSSDPPATAAIRAYVESVDRRILETLLLDRAEDDDELASELLAAASRSTSVDPRVARQTLKRLFAVRGFIEYREMRFFVARAAPAIDLVQAVLDRGDCLEAANLAEYAFRLAIAAMERGDDSDGGMGGIVSRIAELHAQAAVRNAYPPKELAKRLLDLELSDGYGFFDRARYRAALGEDGWTVYRTLAEAMWAKVPVRNAAGKGKDGGSGHYEITRIMKALAEEGGDVDALVEVLRRDLGHSGSYLEIAKVLSAAGRDDEALTWAEEARRAFPRQLDSPLEEFLVDAYHRRKRHDDALQMRWSAYESYPGVESYRRLKESADRAKAWPAWREKAFTLALRRRDSASRRGRANAFAYRSEASLPVAILLWEGKADEALKEARAGGCDTALWVRLAEAIEKTQPPEAIRIYGEQIAPIVARTHNAAYEEAIGLVRRMRVLLAQAGNGTAFGDIVADLRHKHRAKRNFVALLEALPREAAEEPAIRRGRK